MVNNQLDPKVPLSNADEKALAELFAPLETEDIHQIERVASRFSPAPLDPWQEKAWVLASTLPERRAFALKRTAVIHAS
jgi:hypothetical protein